MQMLLVLLHIVEFQHFHKGFFFILSDDLLRLDIFFCVHQINNP